MIVSSITSLDDMYLLMTKDKGIIIYIISIIYISFIHQKDQSRIMELNIISNNNILIIILINNDIIIKSMHS